MNTKQAGVDESKTIMELAKIGDLIGAQVKIGVPQILFHALDAVALGDHRNATLSSPPQ
jgi:hypothetical protein